jgi:hypothetical protein
MTADRAQRAIEKMAKERQSFIAWVQSVSPEDWARLSPDGMWQARDYVAHLASIDPLLVGIMRSFQREGGMREAGEAARRFSIDDWNEEQILSRREHSIDELIFEMDQRRADLNIAMAAFTDEQLDRTFHFGGDKSRSPREVQVGEFLRGLVYHDRWHMEDARRAIAGEAEQQFGDNAFETMLTSDPSSAE